MRTLPNGPPRLNEQENGCLRPTSLVPNIVANITDRLSSDMPCYHDRVIRPFCIMLLYQYLLHYGLLLHVMLQYLWLFSLILQGLP